MKNTPKLWNTDTDDLLASTFLFQTVGSKEGCGNG